MRELFETVLILSLLGFFLALLLLCLKPLTAKRFPAKWQYYVWITVLIVMIVPGYKLIPDKEVEKIQQFTHIEAPQTDVSSENEFQSEAYDTPPITEFKINVSPALTVSIFDILSLVWLGGMIIYLVTVIISYFLYLLRKRKNSVSKGECDELAYVKEMLGIRRRIRVRASYDTASPMLVGVFFPVIYIPLKEIPSDMLKLVFLHELTHYKRKDLIVKWFALFVNGVHWFNPLSYIISANLSEACEVSCDMEVTKNMDEEEQKLYMKTILALVEK